MTTQPKHTEPKFTFTQHIPHTRLHQRPPQLIGHLGNSTTSDILTRTRHNPPDTTPETTRPL